MAYEVTRDMPLEDQEVETPIRTHGRQVVAGRQVGVVPISGPGWVWSTGLRLIRGQVGHIGCTRSGTLKPWITASCRWMWKSAR